VTPGRDSPGVRETRREFEEAVVAVEDTEVDVSGGDEAGFREPPDGLLTTPENRVLAHMDAPDAVAAAIEELADAGFASDEIFVLCGPAGAARLDVSGHDHGLMGRVRRVVEWMGDEREVLLRSGEHLAAGGLVVTVPAGEPEKATVARILRAHGGREISHFAKGTWERLGA
jgi:hypothetical protein